MDLPEQSIFYREIAEGRYTLFQMQEKLKSDEKLLKIVLDGWKYGDGAVRSGCEKILIWMSEREPALLYQHFDFLCGFLKSPNQTLHVAAVNILMNLLVVDRDERFENRIDDFYYAMKGPNITMAVNLVNVSEKLAALKPQYLNKVVPRLMSAESGKFQNDDCRDIVIGKVLDFILQFYPQLKEQLSTINQWIKRQAANKRIATRKKAKAAIEKYNID